MSIDADPLMGLLTIADVTKLLKVSSSTVRRLQQGRKIPFVKVGGVVRFMRSDVDAYVAGRRVSAIDQ